MMKKEIIGICSLVKKKMKMKLKIKFKINHDLHNQ